MTAKGMDGEGSGREGPRGDEERVEPQTPQPQTLTQVSLTEDEEKWVEAKQVLLTEPVQKSFIRD